MAQSKKLTKMHNDQVAAARELFETYKKFIVEEFVDTFGGSYQTVENLPCDWRDYFAYKPECEEFLIEKTKTFIHAYPASEHFYQSPTFLRNLTSLISEHLSKYIAKKGWDRNTCTKYLKEILFDKNNHIQLELKRYADKNHHDWKKRLHEQKQQQQTSNINTKRKRQHITHGTPVVYSDEQEQELREKSLQERIRILRIELSIEGNIK